MLRLRRFQRQHRALFGAHDRRHQLRFQRRRKTDRRQLAAFGLVLAADRSSHRRANRFGDRVRILGRLRVLRQLLRERVPVRDLVTILESIADAAQTTKDPDAITEAVRAAMGRTICRQYQTERGELPAISFAPALEAKLMSSIVRTEQGPVLALEPSQAQQLASRIADALAGALAQPVLLCTPTLRPHLWRLFARVLPHIGVLSHSEIPPQLRIATVAVLD